MSDSIWDAFAATLLFTWDDRGVRALSGPWSDPVPGTVHVVTAWNPDGLDAGPHANAEAHRRLVDEIDGRGWSWAPAVGASPDGAHHEISVLVRDRARAEAVALGRSFGQLAVFELDDDTQRVVPCDGSPVREVARDRCDVRDEVTSAALRQWRDEHEAATGRRLPRTTCPRCGAEDPQRILYGMPAGLPPDRFAVGGCVIGDDDPALRCASCTHEWSTG